MYKFPSGVYTDVRIERRKECRFFWKLGKFTGRFDRDDESAFIRVYDGGRWYYSSVFDCEEVQGEIDRLSSMAVSANLRGNPVIEAFSVNRGGFGNRPALAGDAREKKEAVESVLFPSVPLDSGVYWTLCYEDRAITRHFVSSRGADLTAESGGAGYRYRFTFSDGGSTLSTDKMDFSGDFHSLLSESGGLGEYIEKRRDFNKKAVPLEKGFHTVILSPICAGLFAHESFGHQSEADLMTGQGALIRKWSIGSTVASRLLSIFDDGSAPGVGRITVDDEGTLCGKTWLIKNGVLSGRLHSVETASHFGEKPTGNARAVDSSHEPIVRMTNTCIASGDTPVDDLFSEVENGVFVESIRGGSGLSRFTMTPVLAWRIKNGRIAEPLRISVLAGDVKETLREVDGVSEKCRMFGSVDGGCGKFGQTGLRVGFGGPHVRVRKLEVL